MSKDSFSSSGIGNMLDYGIDLKLESIEEELYYISQMCDYFNEETDFRAYLSGEISFEIETDKDNVLLEVVIKNSTLLILPYSDDFFEVFTLILAFIAREHERIIKDLRCSIPADRIQAPSEIKEDSIEEESSSEDDYEWI